MAWQPIEIAPGLVSDDTPFKAQGSWRDGSLIRFRKGAAEVCAGYERMTLSDVPGVCRNVATWKDPLGTTIVALGTHTNLQLWRNGRLADITPTGLAAGREDTATGPGWGVGQFGVGPWGRSQEGTYFARTWSMANWGMDLLANPRGGGLYQWQNASPDAVAQPVQNAPSVAYFMLVTPQRQVLLFGTTQEADGVFNPMCIRVSDTENLTNWAITAQDNADEIILEGSGRIVGASLFDQGFAVWTDSKCFAGRYVGSTSQSYSMTEIDGAPGLLGPNAMANTGTSLFWLTPDLQLYRLDVGTSVAVPVTIPILDDTLGEIARDQGDKVTLSYVRQNSELRIDYPDARDGRENSRYLTLGLVDNAWSKGEQARSAFHVGITNPIGVEPVHNTQANVALALDFSNSAQNGTTVQNGVLTGTQNGLLWSCSATGSTLTIPNLSINGSIYQYVGLDIERITNSSGGGYGGITYYATAGGHGESESFRSQAQPNLAIGERATLVWDMSDLQFGAADWVQNTVSELRFALDYGAGGQFLVHGLRVYGDDIAAPSTSTPYYHERGASADGGALSWYLESNVFALDDDESRMLVRSIKPDVKNQQGVAQLSIFFSDEMNDGQPETVVGPFDIGPSTGRIDLFASGKLARFRLEGSSAPASLRLGKMLFDVVPMGQR